MTISADAQTVNEIKSDTDKTKMILELLGLRFEDILKIIQNPDERVSHTSLSSIDILKTLEDIMEGAEYELLIESISDFIYSNIKKYPSVFFESHIKTLLGNYSDQILQSKNEKLIQLISLLFGDDFLRQNSSPVDLKDRFKTWFVHYVDVAPNTSASLPTNLITDIYSATTHLSADTKAALKLVDNPKRIEEIGRVVVGYPVILQVRVMVEPKQINFNTFRVSQKEKSKILYSLKALEGLEFASNNDMIVGSVLNEYNKQLDLSNLLNSIYVSPFTSRSKFDDSTFNMYGTAIGYNHIFDNNIVFDTYVGLAKTNSKNQYIKSEANSYELGINLQKSFGYHSFGFGVAYGIKKTDVKNYDFLEFSLKGKFDSEYINTNANYIYNAYTKDGFSVAPFFDVNYLYSKADDHELDTMIGDERFYQYFSDFRQKTLLASAGVGFTQELNKLSLYFAPRIQQEIINDGSEFVSHFGGSRFSINPDDKKDMYLALSLGVNSYVNDRLSLGFNINGKQKISNRDKEYQNINGMLKVKYDY